MSEPRTITSHGVPRQIPGRGPNGRRFCRWCHSEVPKGRRSYCNDDCMQHAVFNYSRLVAVRRDKYACTACGRDGRHPYRWPRPENFRELPALEVDHVVAVKDGGSHHPDNLRTLCRDCHKARTAEQRRTWAAERQKGT
jgi:5-methylcytosine-specific restriction endonuclease McrA